MDPVGRVQSKESSKPRIWDRSFRSCLANSFHSWDFSSAASTASSMLFLVASFSFLTLPSLASSGDMSALRCLPDSTSDLMPPRLLLTSLAVLFNVFGAVSRV